MLICISSINIDNRAGAHTRVVYSDSAYEAKATIGDNGISKLASTESCGIKAAYSPDQEDTHFEYLHRLSHTHHPHISQLAVQLAAVDESHL